MTYCRETSYGCQFERVFERNTNMNIQTGLNNKD